MPPARKRTSTSSKSSSSTNGAHSPTSSSYECGGIVWCKYKKYPYWPGIIWEKTTKSSRTLYEILFFGTFSLGLAIDRKWLEAFAGVAEFKKRLAELKASEILLKNKASQYDMNITLANLESFQEAVKQASKVQKCSTASERLKLADSMRKGVTCDFFQLQLDDYEEEEQDETEEIDENNSHAGDDNMSIVFMPPIQNDRQFIQNMINQGRRKRKLDEGDDDEDDQQSNAKIRRMTIKTEPEPLSSNPPPSILFQHSLEQPLVMCSNFACHSLSPMEEKFILDAIARCGSHCSFIEAKQIAEEMYSNIICVNNSNRPLPQLFSTHSHWLDELEKSQTSARYLFEQEQQIVRLMKTYLR